MHAATFSEALINISDQQYRQLICRFISRAPDAPAIITDRGIADTSKFSIFIDMPEKTRKNSDYKKYMWHCINATQFIISSSSSDCFLCVPTPAFNHFLPLYSHKWEKHSLFFDECFLYPYNRAQQLG